MNIPSNPPRSAFVAILLATLTFLCTFTATAGLASEEADVDTTAGGIIAAPPVPLWGQAPVVYDQYVMALGSSGYSSAWQRWNNNDYVPVGISAYRRLSGARRYSGRWRKDENVTSWLSKRNLTGTAYQSLWNEMTRQGYRVLDVDAHVRGDGSPRYHVIFVKEKVAKPFYSHRSLSGGALDAKIVDYGANGYRPLRINGYRPSAGLRYAAVWVKDSITDYRVKRDLTSAQYSSWWNFYRNQGYSPSDISAYRKNGRLRFAGIWVKDTAVKNWVSKRNRTRTQLKADMIQYREANYVLRDLDAYRGWGGERFSAIWVRLSPRNVVVSNQSLANWRINTLKNRLNEYRNGGSDGRSGVVGFYVEDLTNGNYVAFNPHEPFYLASTTKGFIGGKVVSMPELPNNQLYTLTDSDWRGEETRGFTESDIGDQFPVEEFLDNMIDNSDTASTDKLFGKIKQFDGNFALHDFMNDAGMVNYSEITSICSVDKRIRSGRASCVYSVPCHSFETWLRGGDTKYATAQDLACFATHNASTVSNQQMYDRYYDTLANTATPAEYGRYWRELADHDLLTTFDEGDLVRQLDKNGSYNPHGSTYYQAWGGKNGGKYKVTSWVGLGWNWDYGAGDYSSLTHQYSVAIFTEQWSSTDTTAQDLADAIITDIVRYTVPFLNGKR